MMKKGQPMWLPLFVIPMLNSVDFVAEDDYIADEGENVARETVEVFVVETIVLVTEEYV